MLEAGGRSKPVTNFAYFLTLCSRLSWTQYIYAILKVTALITDCKSMKKCTNISRFQTLAHKPRGATARHGPWAPLEAPADGWAAASLGCQGRGSRAAPSLCTGSSSWCPHQGQPLACFHFESNAGFCGCAACNSELRIPNGRNLLAGPVPQRRLYPAPAPAAAAHLQPAVGGASPQHGGGALLPAPAAESSESPGKEPREKSWAENPGKETRERDPGRARPRRAPPDSARRPATAAPAIAFISGEWPLIAAAPLPQPGQSRATGIYYRCPCPAKIYYRCPRPAINPCFHKEHVHTSMTLVPGLTHICRPHSCRQVIVQNLPTWDVNPFRKKHTHFSAFWNTDFIAPVC